MNVRLLRRVQRAILAEPRKFNMASYFSGSESSPCGTTACIGGWAVALDRKVPSLNQALKRFMRENPRRSHEWLAVEASRKSLKLSETEHNRLTHSWDWPAQYKDRYWDAKTDKDRARVAAQRIDHFIKTKGEE